MNTRIRSITATLAVVCALALTVWLQAAESSLPTGKPEEVGLSSGRLTRINELIQRHIDVGDISGAVTLVARRGHIAHLEAHGTTALEGGTPTATDSVFRIASMTKVITGVAVMMMVEEGKLRVTDPVSLYIPEFKNLEVAVEHSGRGEGNGDSGSSFDTVLADREVTVRDLLTHTSGLVSGPISNASERPVAQRPGDTLADYVPRLGQTVLEFQPGSRWSYSPGAGFQTLGRIVEIVSGLPLDGFMQERIFDPLGMEDTSFHPTATLASRLVTAYRRTADGVELDPDPDRMQRPNFHRASGGLVSTAEDYVKFGQMLLDGGVWKGERLLSPRTVEQMAALHIADTLPGRPVGEGYGLSVRVLSDAVVGGSRLSDGSYGWSGAFGTHFWIDPRDEIVAILMIQTPIGEMRPAFENAVMQAIID